MMSQLQVHIGRAAASKSIAPAVGIRSYLACGDSSRHLSATNANIRSVLPSVLPLHRATPTSPRHLKLRYFSTSSITMSKHSEACCSIPPVITEGYQAKGSYGDLNGTKTYITGPSDATAAILIIYDIFGFKDQIIQGADILATSHNDKNFQVFMPDMFEGNPADIAWYPPNTPEKKEKLESWFSTAAPPKHLSKFEPFLKAAQEKNSNIKSWGIIGYCWGGKMVSLLGGQQHHLFKAGLQTSPAMVDPEDAAKVQIPMAVLASKEEPADAIKQYDEKLTVKKHVETFSTQIHGWMSARADLSDGEVKKEYERGYSIALNWFHEHL